MPTTTAITGAYCTVRAGILRGPVEVALDAAQADHIKGHRGYVRSGSIDGLSTLISRGSSAGGLSVGSTTGGAYIISFPVR